MKGLLQCKVKGNLQCRHKVVLTFVSVNEILKGWFTQATQTQMQAQAQANTCDLPQCKRKRKRQCKKWKIFHFLMLAFVLAFAFHTCELGQRKSKRKCQRKFKMKNTRSMPVKFSFKPRWHPLLPSLISLPESSFPDCWSRVTQTLEARLPPSWDTEMHIRISFCLHLHSTCEHCLCLLLHLHHTCEPA